MHLKGCQQNGGHYASASMCRHENEMQLCNMKLYKQFCLLVCYQYDIKPNVDNTGPKLPQ